MGEAAKRAELARWKWKTGKGRAAIRNVFETHGRHLTGDWCDREECLPLTQEAERLGSSPDRFIQIWPTKRQFMEVMQSCGQPICEFDHVYVFIMDGSDIDWIRMSAPLVLAQLVPAASEWMTDGFIVFEPTTKSVLSVDVEERYGRWTIETTVIGHGFAELRKCLSEHGPAPQPIVDQDRLREQRGCGEGHHGRGRSPDAR